MDLIEMAAEKHPVGSARDKDVYRPQLQDLPPIAGDGTILLDVSITSYRLSVPPFRFHEDLLAYLEASRRRPTEIDLPYRIPREVDDDNHHQHHHYYYYYQH
nr:unnamed protein product [Spirometra erinaceieuropaei]